MSKPSLRELIEKELYAMHIRMDIHTNDEAMNVFISRFNTKKWAYSRERDPKDHTHMVITSYDPFPTAPTLNRWIKQDFGLVGPQKSTSSVRTTVQRCLTYICKESDLVYKGFSPKMIKGLKAQSTKKFSKEKLANELFELETKYYANDIGSRYFATEYGRIRSQYGQSHTKSSVCNYLSKHYFRKNKEARDTFYEQCVDSLGDV